MTSSIIRRASSARSSLFTLALFTVSTFFAGTAQAQTSGNTLFTANQNRPSLPISANALFLYRQSKEGNLASSEEPNGFGIQELELAFAADVDPYSRLAILLSVHPEYEDDTTGRMALEYHLEPEEAYAETTAIPYVTLKGGKFKTVLGKHNQIHTHAYPFIDAPLLQSALLGEEGFNDVGVSASALIPLPWFSELTVQAVSGEGEEITYFNSRSNNDLATVARLRNLWDLNDSSTLEFGLSGAEGDNQFDDNTVFAGADLTYKWRPVEGTNSHAFIWSTEVLQRTENEALGKNQSAGLATWVQGQVAKRWWLQARAEWLDAKDEGTVTNANDGNTNKWSALVGFIPSEFSGIRLQGDRIAASGMDEAEYRMLIQFNFSIGAHPAHAY